MENLDGKQTSGEHRSSWEVYEGLPQLGPLENDAETEVLVIGAGISGLCVAYELTKRGKKVTVIDDGLPGSGETGRTSAHLTAMLDHNYTEYIKELGREKAAMLAESHMAGISFIEKAAAEERIDCNFKRVSGYLFVHPSDPKTILENEMQACADVNLQVAMAEMIPGMLKEVKGLEFRNQGQFHPMKFVYGLCRAITERGGQIYVNSHASEIDSEGAKLENGSTIKAKHVVVATNVPVNNKFVMTFKQHPCRTYMIGALIEKGSLQPALWWDSGDYQRSEEIGPYHYVRVQEMNETHDLLLIGGEDHPTGNTAATNPDIPEEERYKLLDKWGREHFHFTEVVYRWSGQVMESMDGAGFIGRNPFDKQNVYIVTGDSGDGLTNGAIAGMLIPDLIDGIENPWEELYNPMRNGLKGAIKGALAIAGSVFSKKPEMADESAIDTLQPGEGKLVTVGKEKCGAYRHPDGSLTLVSAICPHMGCAVAWNGDEKTWDCPCHGSRFTPAGKVINGPAIDDLPSISEKR
jgi:glycine/D-amino acid oxidase-like deaminating enzyme/nitrite reductase/ring-hydroxylating ferredoxin subunit